MAVDSEIMSILKDLPHRLDSSKLKDRIRIFKDIDNVVAIEGLPDGVLKGLCKIPILTLHQYKNTKSRSFITNLILKLLKYNENLVVKYLTTNLVDISSNFKCLTITPTVADDCLTCLTWSCIVMKYILDKKNTSSPAIKDLIQSQVILVSCALAANDKIITKKAYKRMQHVWSTPDAVDTYRSFIVDYKEPPNCHVVVFNSQFVQFLNDNKQVALIKDLKQCYIEQFLKSMVVGKVDKAPKYVLIQLKPLLRHVNHEEFKERLLPSMQKAMLRNPEIVLPCVSAIIDSVTIDLSQYASDIGKILTPQLHSNMEECRVEAIQACSLLAKQSSDPQTLSEIVKYIFAVLNGCNGKLTVVTQRIGLISGIGNLSNNTVSGTSSLQELSSLVSDSFVTVLKQEVHEDILISALNSLSLWSPKFSSKVPKSLIDIFKTGPGLKTSTSAVRNAYIRCMISSFHGNTLTDAVEVVPQLIKTIEKALSQSNHVSYVAEGLSASCLILNIHRADLIIDKQISNCISNLLDMQKVPFFTEKFINQVDDEGIMSLITFIERLMCDHFTSIKGCKKPIYSAILQIMTHSSQKVRKRSHHSLRKIINLFNSVDIPKSLLLELCAFLDSHQFLFPNMVKDDVNENNESSNFVNAVYAVSALECITSELDVKDPNVEVDIESLALMALNASCHPIILTIERDMYLKVLNNLGLDVDSFIENHSEELMKSIIEMNSPLLRKSVESVVQISPLNLLPQFINFAVEIFENHNFGKVSKTDYEIFLTPEGELYDRSCIENMKEEVQTKNVKRESKLYSYKDQMADIALRKELEEKKKAKGVKVEPQLTKKQQEAMKAQLEKESSIRSDVKLLHKNFNQAMHIMESCLNGNSEYFLREMSYILPIMISNLSSPLCAEKIANFFVNLGKRIFKSDIYLGLSIAYVLLRIKKPAFTIDNAWTEEDLTAAIKRVVSKLYSSTRPKSKSDFVDSNSDNSRFHDGILTAPAFSYAFVLLKEVLRLNLHDYEDEIMKSVEMISDHTHMRSSFDELMDPQLLPIKSMFQALISLLADASGKLQVLTSQAIEDVACCSSGKDDCAAASEEETTLLLDSLLYSSTAVRDSVLRSLIQMTDIILVWKSNESFCTLLTQRLFVAQFDLVDDVKELAKQLWDACSLKLNDKLADYLIKDVCHPAETIRHSSSLALANYIGQFPKITNGILKSLFAIYHSKLEMPAPILDNFGRLVSEPPADPWEPRSGIALSMCKMASSFTSEDVQELMSFFVPEGLGDRHEDVRKEMLNAAMAVIDIHGKDQVLHLLPVFEDFLDKAPKTSSYDTVRQSVVILMGCLARHLDKTDPKVKPIIYKLIDALSTPSQQVQEAVSNCLPPLIPAVKEEAPALVKRLLNLLLESDNYGERKGAAYGLAGLVKGLGILALKQLDIMNSLTTAIQNKKNHKHREGALFAFEMLCSVLGRLFEPYIVHVLPHLLLCFGDGNQYVREATDDTAKAVMSKLSAHGVKLVLPSLLAALEEDSWRTKTGSVELLGAMAFCAPKQLSSCLPNIVPKLIEVLSDSHAKVQKAGAQALKVIGSVIRNPEIQAIVDVLLEALQDPSKKTAVCLGTLLNTKFIHFIDAPSLALIMPVVQRAFKDRSTETRKMAAQIIGNMYSLTDHKDLGPYLPNITPGLQQSLLDPVPDVRCVSARALGAMVKGMGESCFETLMPWLMQTLTSETSSVDRSGAAQGLSEVIGGLGVDKLHKLMPEIISTAQRTDIVAHVKDGYMMLFIYMPVVFPKEFTQYIGKIINPILKALADENEYVRDTALKAGQRIVNMYAENAITLLLPQLEAGLFDENWRIRYSSVQLLGDLLYKISGVSGKMTTETASEDDNFGTEQSQKIILNILGMERRNRVLAGLYMGRSDTALMVRQAALHVWKIIVTNTPRTLREILPTLFSLLLGCLASTSYDKRQVAARTLGDLVRKLGERVLPEIIPILEKGLESNQPDQRQGVCIGLSEIMTSTSREMVLTFVDSLVPTVRKALCDPLPEVRQAAAKTFDSLHSTVGSRALDDILPQLLEQLNNPELSECTLDGLKNVMAIKSRVVLPYLVPQLTAEPVNTKALSFLSAVAGDALNKHLSKILPALLSALGSAMDTSAEQQEKEYCERVILSVQDDLGVRTIMDDLMEATKAKEDKVRRAAVSLLYAFCCQTRADYAQYVSQLIRGLILLFIEKDTKILQLSWDALTAVVKTLEPSEQLQHVSTVRQAVRFVISDSKEALLPGFCLSKGITPILPIFREAILNGQPELKEQAATGLGEVIKITSPEALQPSVVHITGPLIRILGDRFSWNVKASVLDTLALLLAKVGVKLKPFLPQLQTTFLKALIDPHRSVRLKAAAALSHLIVIHTRVDQLFTDLRNNVKTVEESGIRETMLQALRGIITPAGNKISESVRKQLVQTLVNLTSHHEDVTRMSAAGCLGAFCTWLPDDELQKIVTENILEDDPSDDWTIRHGKSVILFVALKEAAPRILTNSWSDGIMKTIHSYLTSDRIPIVLSGIRGMAFLMKHILSTNNCNVNQKTWNTYVKLMNHSSNEVKQLIAQTIQFLSKSCDTLLPTSLLKSIIPQLVNGTKEKNTIVKANCEYALVAVLKLRDGESNFQTCLNSLDSGAKDSLNDVVSKVLRKVASHPDSKEDELDDTLLI